MKNLTLINEGMKHPKAHYKALNIDGFRWSGFWDGLHHFSKQNKEGHPNIIRCTEDCISDGRLKIMIKHNISM